MADVDPVPLAEFIDALRDELRAAQIRADPLIPIEVGQVTVEFTVAMRRSGGGKAGVRFFVVNVDAEGTLGSERTQKVTMQLRPLSADGSNYRAHSVEDEPRSDSDAKP